MFVDAEGERMLGGVDCFPSPSVAEQTYTELSGDISLMHRTPGNILINFDFPDRERW